MDVQDLYQSANLLGTFNDPDAPKLSINLNEVVDSKLVEGLLVDARNGMMAWMST